MDEQMKIQELLEQISSAISAYKQVLKENPSNTVEMAYLAVIAERKEALRAIAPDVLRRFESEARTPDDNR